MAGADAANDAVLSANARFYDAMRTRDLVLMERLWARKRNVSCTHPGWKTVVGRDAVMESWELILGNQAVDIETSGHQLLLFGSTALVLCVEQVERASAFAANTLVREGHDWRFQNHQAMAFRV